MIADPAFLVISVRECVRDALGARHQTAALQVHLRAAMEWLRAAQQQAGNGGVSAGFGRSGWWSDYPETTGYIIVTFLDYYHLTSDLAFREWAIGMGGYELGVQMPDGAIPGGYAHPRVPCVFDTGQVILGWLALYRETRQAEYLAAACRAGDWLRSVQASDGSWRTHDHAGRPRTYHASVGWALVALGLATGERGYTGAGRRQVAWVLGNQRPNGWFARAELRGHAAPVTHTIAYTIRGVLESGLALQDEGLVAAARAAADVLARGQLADGSLHGAYDAEWQPAARWRCLTGCAQMSVNWLRLYEVTQDRRYFAAAQRSNEFLRCTQDLRTQSPVRGALKGSLPFYGAYQRFSYPNWATKFFADALMLEHRLTPAQRLACGG